MDGTLWVKCCWVFFVFFVCFPVSGGGSGVLIDELRETTKGGGGVTPVC